MKQCNHDKTLCPLCGGQAAELYYRKVGRCYVYCRLCRLIHVPEEYWPDAERERAEYDKHENIPDDPGYRRFLSRLAVPMFEKLGAQRHGLDFGCGPGPALAAMFEERGHRVELYDPFYAPDRSVLHREYDFICATEVVEHFRNPRKEFETLFSCLKTGGWLGIMTGLTRDDRTAFANWHYIRDPTHIAFYHRKTFQHLASQLNARVGFAGQGVILMQKQR